MIKKQCSSKEHDIEVSCAVVRWNCSYSVDSNLEMTNVTLTRFECPFF